MSSRSLLENIQGCLQSFDQILKSFPASDRDVSSISLAETVEACTEQFEQILELFPDEVKGSSEASSSGVLDRVSKFLHSTDKDSIHGLSRKQISRTHVRFKHWEDRAQHILDNQSDLSSSRPTREFVKLMLEAVIDVKDGLIEIHKILSASRAKRFWKSSTDTYSLYTSCRGDIDYLFLLADHADRHIKGKRAEEVSEEDMFPLFGQAFWKKHEADQERKEWLRQEEEKRLDGGSSA